MQFIELLDVKLCMLGPHQLQNAATATCAALCLQNQGENLTNHSSFGSRNFVKVGYIFTFSSN